MKIIKRLLAFVVFIFFMTTLSAQEKYTNVMSTSLIRLENDLNMPFGKFNAKFMAGFEYQKHVKKFLWGFKYEHGINQHFDEFGINCDECYIGRIYTREDNFYLNVHYPLMKNKRESLILNSGIAAYYANINRSGMVGTGFEGTEVKFINYTRHHIGMAPSLTMQYFPHKQFFLALNSTLRMGLVPMKKYNRNYHEFVITAPELRMGICF
jgi:hypothetical protein